MAKFTMYSKYNMQQQAFLSMYTYMAMLDRYQ